MTRIDPPPGSPEPDDRELRHAPAAEGRARVTAEENVDAASQELAREALRLRTLADERAAELIELTERLMSEVSVRERTERRMAARYAAERAVTEGQNPLDMARRMIGELCRRLTGMGWGSFWWRDEDALVCIDGVAAGEGDAPLFWGLTGLRLTGEKALPMAAIASGAAVWRRGRTGDAALDRAQAAFSAFCAIPVAADGTVNGVVLLASRGPAAPG